MENKKWKTFNKLLNKCYFHAIGEELPFDTAPEDKKAAAAITVDDLLKVAAQKITTNRKNSPKIKALLTSYGCGAVSELPEDKREAFLNDLAQL